MKDVRDVLRYLTTILCRRLPSAGIWFLAKMRLRLGWICGWVLYKNSNHFFQQNFLRFSGNPLMYFDVVV